jgi:hypothetical protein
MANLLDLKQKQANVFEARASRRLAVESASAGGTLMVFTIVTVIFLPLSFLAAFFAIVLEGLPYNERDRLPLNFILKYVVGVGLSTALAFVLMAWHHHSAVRWYQSAVRWYHSDERWYQSIVRWYREAVRWPLAKAKPLVNVFRWMWMIIIACWLKNIFGWKRQEIVGLRPGHGKLSSDRPGSGHTMVSPGSSNTMRERRSNLQDDLEKGRD